MAAPRRAAATSKLRTGSGATPATEPAAGDPGRHDTLRSAAMTLFKQALASGDGAPLAAFLAEALRQDGSAGGPLLALLQAERARLVKLKTLGQTGDFERRIGLTEAFIRTVQSGGRP